jgi:hypothetical protein
MPSPYLVVATIFKNEAPFLAEWVAFHRLVGVDHLYLYDNGSTDNPEASLAPFLDEGCVTLVPWPIPYHQKAQDQALTDCLNRVRGAARWLACIDVDEFLFSPSSFRIDSVLKDFEEYPGVVACWRNYGASGAEHASSRPVIARFAQRAPSRWIRNRRVKSIADPNWAVAASAHYFTYRDGAHAVTESREPLRVGRKPRSRNFLRPLYRMLGPATRFVDPYGRQKISNRTIPCERLRVNHYPVKSREEFVRKSQLMEGKKRYDRFDYFAYHNRNEVFDPILWRYLPALAQRGIGNPIEAERLAARAAQAMSLPA